MTSPDASRLRSWFWCVWSLLFAGLSWLEFIRLKRVLNSDLGVAGWFSSFWDMETTLAWWVMLTLPVLVWIVRRGGSPLPIRNEAITERDGRWRTTASAITVFAISLLCSLNVGLRPVEIDNGWQRQTVAFADLPPAYHDEYSYLLQARTFLAGRLSWPGMSVRPDLFHQFHVLNEHSTVSRYFPWTGLWIAPFEAFGKPIYGHWLAGALAAAIFYLSFRQIATQRLALVGGLLIAVSPGIAVFSNLLLAHHPTLLALSVFTWAFFRMMHTRQLRFAFVAGVGLTLAMLARPMTAAGFGLPFGLWMALQLVRDRSTCRLATGFVVPLLIGFGFLAILNTAATGSYARSAYQEYTDQFTPRHRYGFNNAVESTVEGSENAEVNTVPPALQAYDRWATNLTPARAVKNLRQRFWNSLIWSLAIVPLVLGLLMAVPMLFRSQCQSGAVTGMTEFRLLATAFVTLHIVHLPYWFDGIMHWHYVFETAPLLLIVAAAGFAVTVDQLQPLIGKRFATGWVTAVVLAGLIPGWIALPQYDGLSKVSAAVSEQSFSRRRFEVFRRLVQDASVTKPALIMVDESGSDPQLSYIINPPDLSGPVLVCRRPETNDEIPQLREAFPDRSLYLFHPQTMQLKPWPQP